jgi:hypothetical protein
MVETGHFPSWPLIEIRRPCISSSQTLSTVPALPSVRITALPTSSVCAERLARTLCDRRNAMLRYDHHGRPYIWSHDGHCSLCDMLFPDDATLFMVSRDDRRPHYRYTQRATAPVCGSCLTDSHRAGAKEANRTVTCKSCGHTMVACVLHFQKSTCCQRCERRLWRARRRMTMAKTKTICATCRASFEPLRSDGRFCSNACRQRSYRLRRHNVA